MNRKAVIDLGVILVLIIVILAFGWLVNEGWKECRVNSDCKENQYCGSDFDCHDFKVVVTDAQSPYRSFTTAAWILGISLVIAALIFKSDTLFGRNKKAQLSFTHNSEEQGMYEEDYED